MICRQETFLPHQKALSHWGADEPDGTQTEMKSEAEEQKKKSTN